MEVAAENGRLSTLKYLHSGPCPAPWNGEVLTAAVGSDDCLMWLLAQAEARKWSGGLVVVAADMGNMPLLEYLRNHANSLAPLQEWSADATAVAASSGHLAVLQWLRSQHPKVPWNTEVCLAAAANGDMTMLQWARQQNHPAPWDAEMCARAASNGNLDILSWLRAQQPCCPWDADVTLETVQAYKLSTLQWLLAQQPPCPLQLGCVNEAVWQGNVQMLQLISEHGQMPNGDQYWHAAQLGHLDILRWLHRKKVPVCRDTSVTVCDEAISAPILLFLGDIGTRLTTKQQQQVVQIRKAYCTLYGLLRWCRQAVSDPSKSINRAFIAFSTKASGQNLLVGLSMLPAEVLDMIALAAGLRHTLLQNATDNHLYPPPYIRLTRYSTEIWKSEHG